MLNSKDNPPQVPSQVPLNELLINATESANYLLGEEKYFLSLPLEVRNEIFAVCGVEPEAPDAYAEARRLISKKLELLSSVVITVPTHQTTNPLK